jgi:hypothetical protein
MTTHKAQLNCDGAPGSLPGWYDFKRGTREACHVAARLYLDTGGKASVRVVPADTSNADPEAEARWLAQRQWP